jgi:hypothetical protein
LVFLALLAWAHPVPRRNPLLCWFALTRAASAVFVCDFERV